MAIITLQHITGFVCRRANMKLQADMSSKMTVAMYGDGLDARDPAW